MAPEIQEQNELLTKFTTFMRDKRKALGLNQRDLAFEVYGNRTKATFINDIEMGRRKGITIDTMNKILVALKSDINFLEF